MNDVGETWIVRRLSIAAILIFCVEAGTVVAQSDSQVEASTDQIWLQPRSPSSDEIKPWFAPAIRTLRGQIIGFDAEKLELIIDGESGSTQFAADRVLWIQPADFEALEGPMVDLYRQGQYAASLAKLPELLKRRPSIWRQQWMTMLAANAAWKSGRSKIALELVSQLDRRPLPPTTVAWLPIAWQRGVQSADAVREAESRLSDSSPAVRLVAASWLLSSSQRREAAAVLKQIAAGDRSDLAQLAEPLLWRSAPPPQIKESARQWEQRLNAMPMVFQPGPTRTLIDQFQAAGLSDDAKRLRWAVELVPIRQRLGD